VRTKAFLLAAALLAIPQMAAAKEEGLPQQFHGHWCGSDDEEAGYRRVKRPCRGEDAAPVFLSAYRMAIYHMPGQRFYDKTDIDPSKGERWFCTEDEAIGAGWRKSKV
jgi:hypothetical protein